MLGLFGVSSLIGLSDLRRFPFSFAFLTYFIHLPSILTAVYVISYVSL